MRPVVQVFHPEGPVHLRDASEIPIKSGGRRYTSGLSGLTSRKLKSPRQAAMIRLEGNGTVDLPDRDDARGVFRDYRPNRPRPIDAREIFREMIAQEVRSGRLTPARRQRIVRYAADLRISAEETGRLIAECREEALESGDPDVTYHAMRLVEPPPAAAPLMVKIATVVAVVIVVHLILTRWL